MVDHRQDFSATIHYPQKWHFNLDKYVEFIPMCENSVYVVARGPGGDIYRILIKKLKVPATLYVSKITHIISQCCYLTEFCTMFTFQTSSGVHCGYLMGFRRWQCVQKRIRRTVSSCGPPQKNIFVFLDRVEMYWRRVPNKVLSKLLFSRFARGS